MALKLNGSTDGSVSLDAPADTSPTGTDVTLTLPTSAGSSGQYLQTNGSGTLSWQTVTVPTLNLPLAPQPPCQLLAQFLAACHPASEESP